MTNPSTPPVLQRAVPSRYHFSSVPLQHGSGPLLQPSITMRGTASVPLRYGFGTARALYYNARCRLGTASVPLGPSITMRSADAPFAFYKVLIRSE